MKKVLFIGILFGSMAVTSCKKDYTCECTVSSNMPGYSTTSSTTTITDKKDEAKAQCESGSTTVTTAQYQITTDCRIK